MIQILARFILLVFIPLYSLLSPITSDETPLAHATQGNKRLEIHALTMTSNEDIRVERQNDHSRQCN